MACFLVPVTEAVVTTVATKVIKTKEKNNAKNHSNSVETEIKIPLSRKLKWLNNLLWGGSALLAFEHLWHGEIVPFFPFLTAINNPEEAVIMFKEMLSVGGTMAVFLTTVWVGMVLVANHIVKRKVSDPIANEEV